MPDEVRPGPLSTPVRFCPACGSPIAPPPVTCRACGARHWRNAKPCAGGLVTRDGRLLLLRRAIEPWAGRWDIPGGFCEPDEHPEATAIREIREETGLDVEITGSVGIWMDRYGTDDATMNHYFHAVPIGDADPVPDPGEATEVGWFAPAELPEEIAFPAHAGQVLAAWCAAVADTASG